MALSRIFWASFGGLVVLALGAGSYVVFVPKIGHATRAQIDAALPASLKAVDVPDPEGEARLGRLVAAVGRLDRADVSKAQRNAMGTSDPAALARLVAKAPPVIGEVERLLAEGGLRCPARQPNTMFPEAVRLKEFSKVLALLTADAARRGDGTACGRYATLGLRLAHALEESGGVLIDGLVAVAIEAIATRAAYEAEMADGLDTAGQKAVLALLPVRRQGLPQMAAWLRRDFQSMTLPYLVEPKLLTGELLFPASSHSGGEEARHDLPGTFDPVASARLIGRIYDAGIADAGRPVYAQTREAARLAEEAGKGLPPSQATSGIEGLGVRMWMNSGRNTIGRMLATNSLVFDQLAQVSAIRACDVNLVRAALLLRMGRPVNLPDPFGKGNLRVDRKRRIVWSVGEDGKDDGGAIGATYSERAPDRGRRY